MAGIKRREGGQIEQKGDRIVEGHAKSQIIDGLDADGGEVDWFIFGVTLLVGLGVFDVVEEVGVFAGFFEHSAPGPLVILCANWIAVAPFRFGAEMECPDALVGAEVIAGCAGRDWEVSLGVEVVEAFADGVGEAEVLEVGHLVEVEGEDVAAIDEAEIGALLHAAAGPDEGADEEEKQTEGDDEEAGHGLICGRSTWTRSASGAAK